MVWTLPVVGGYRTSAYGPRSSPGGIGSTTHRGVDIGGRGTDLLVRSVGPGYVLAGRSNPIRGMWVAVRHDDGYTTVYQHLASRRVAPGVRVEAGTPLGVMGQTGTSTAMHLHLEVIPLGRWSPSGTGFSSAHAIDPEPYLRARGVDVRTGTVTVTHSGSAPGGALPDVDTRPITPIEEDDMTPDQARMLEEVHAALGAGGAIGLADAATVLGQVRGLPDALARIHAGTDGVPDVLAKIIAGQQALAAALTELAGVVYQGTDGTPHDVTVYQRLRRVDERG